MKKNNFSEIERLLAPRCAFHASRHFARRVMDFAAGLSETVPVGDADTLRRMRPWSMAAAGLAAALVLFGAVAVTRPGPIPAMAAESLFAKASDYFAHTDGYTLRFEVRTRQSDNFSYTNPALGFVEHVMSVGEDGRWRLDKEGRSAAFDGQYVRVWFPARGWGWKMDAGSAAGVLEQFAPLRDIGGMMNFLEQYAAARDDVRFTRRDRDGEVVLTLRAPALGDFSNAYSRNSSIEESRTRQTYVFSSDDGRLLSAEIDAMLLGMLPRTILRLEAIDYDAVITQFDMEVPPGFEWIDDTSEGRARLAESLPVVDYSGIAADEAVRRMFSAMASWDERSLGVILRSRPMRTLEEKWSGCELIECGRPFTSGQYAGVFVPCKVRFADGKTGRLKLALRNDDGLGAWKIDGGL